MRTNPNLRPLPSRAAVMHVVRLVMVACIVGVAWMEPEIVGAPLAQLAPIGSGFLIVSTAIAGLTHLRNRPSPVVAALQLLLDGAFLAAALAMSGGTQSVLLFVVFAHLVATTLLFSYRTGLKVAMWHSLLLVVVHYLQTPADGSVRRAALTVAGFWLVAIATAACSAINERELRRRREQLAALTAMVEALEQRQHPAEVIDVLLTTAADTFGFVRAAATLSDGEHKQAWALTGGQLRELPEAALPESRGVAETRLLASLEEHDDALLAAALPDNRNVVVLPLTVDRDVVGHAAFERGGRRSSRIAASSAAMLSQFVAHASLKIGALALLAEVRRLATVDGLTGLANRRTFDQTLERELARAGRTGEPLSLLLLDIDHFKAVNDRHGHQAGDAVLRHVGRVLRTAARPMDLPARYGGEEFAVLLPACGPGDAVAVAERLRRAVADNPPLRITASAGVAALQPGMQAGALVTAADEALYAAKRAGRDRTLAAAAPADV